MDSEFPSNHFFDALYNACAAANYCGVRLVDEAAPRPKERLTLKEMARRAEKQKLLSAPST